MDLRQIILKKNMNAGDQPCYVDDEHLFLSSPYVSLKLFGKPKIKSMRKYK